MFSHHRNKPSCLAKPARTRFALLAALACCLGGRCAQAATKPKAPPSDVAATRFGVAVRALGKPRLIGAVPLGTGPAAARGENVFCEDDAGACVRLEMEQSEASGVFTLSLAPVEGAPRAWGLTFAEFPGFARGMAAYRYGEWKAWTKPVAVQRPGDIDADDVLFFLWQYSDGVYGAAIPLAGAGHKVTFGHTGSGADRRFVARAQSDAPTSTVSHLPMMAVGFGSDPYRLIDDVYAQGLDAIDRGSNRRLNKTFPAAFESIGFCTWNAMKLAQSHASVVAAVKTFTDHKFPLGFVLLDDGWFEQRDNKLWAFGSDPAKYPTGLKGLVADVKALGVDNVGVWHTINGYWAGVHPQGPIKKQWPTTLKTYQDQLTQFAKEKPRETFWSPDYSSDEGQEFYNAWYAQLRSEGISFVKVDNQLVIERIARGSVPIWQAATQMQKNLQTAVAKHFSGAVINCMDMTTECLYNFGTSAVARAVEDYFPKETSYNLEKGNAAAHVLAASYNALWFAPMVWPDFDMFQSHHPHAQFHAAARAISGGPIYITDEPGRQNFDVLWPLVYSDGRIIRADQPARPTPDSLFQVQAPRLFKIFSTAGDAGMVAAFNAADAAHVRGTMGPSDVPGLQGERFAVFANGGRDVRVMRAGQRFGLTLNRMEHRLFSVVPIRHGFAPLGLANKLASPVTVTDWQATPVRVDVAVADGGELVIFTRKSPHLVELDGAPLPPSAWAYKRPLLRVQIPVQQPRQPARVAVTVAP